MDTSCALGAIGSAPVTATGGQASYTYQWNESVTFTFDATMAHFVDRECDYRNVAQIVESFTFDLDSTPDNDYGDQNEDDEDFAEVQLTFDI